MSATDPQKPAVLLQMFASGFVDNGTPPQPVANGFVRAFEPGTTTSKKLYRDRLKAQPWNDTPGSPGSGNQVPLDAAARNYSVFLDERCDLQVLTSGFAAVRTIPDVWAAYEFQNVKDFGAIGDGVTNDRAAIQEALDWAARYNAVNPRSRPIIYFPAGIYPIDDSLVVARVVNNQYAFVSMELRGDHRQKTTNGDEGALIKLTNGNVAALVIQGAQGVSVVNLSFLGMNDFSANFNAPLTTEQAAANLIDDTKFYAAGRTNLQSPHAGIAIDAYCDPSFITQASGNRYPGQDTNYRTGTLSGSVTLEGCAFQKFVVGLVVSPTGFTAQAEEIAVRDCEFAYNREAIAICEGQARNVVIENAGSTYSRFFVTNRLYGSPATLNPQYAKFPGCAPHIVKAQIGWTKYLFNVDLGPQNFFAEAIYTELVLSLGYLGPGPSSDGNTGATFIGCTFSFHSRRVLISPPQVPPFRPLAQIGFHLWNYSAIEFIGCGFTTDDGGTSPPTGTRQPFVFFNRAPIAFRSCTFVTQTQGPGPASENGALPIAFNDFGLASGFDQGRALFENTRIQDSTFTTGTGTFSYLHSDYDIDSTRFPIRRQILASPDYVIEGKRLRVIGFKARTFDIGSGTLASTANPGEAVYTPSDATKTSLANVGDVVYLDSATYFPEWYQTDGTAVFNQYNAAAIAGVVKSKTATTITLQYVPKDLTLNATYALTIRYFPRFHDRTYGSTTNGQPTITGVTPDPSPGGIDSWRKNDRIEGPGITPGAFITAVSASQLTLSANATASGTNVTLFNADSVSVRLDGASAATSPAVQTTRYPGARKLLWETTGLLGTEAPSRVYATANGLEFIVNARWDGASWNLDVAAQAAGILALGGVSVFLGSKAAFSAPWTSWTDGINVLSGAGVAEIAPYSTTGIAPLKVSALGTGALTLDAPGGGNIEIGGSAVARSVSIATGLAQQNVDIGSTSVVPSSGSITTLRVKDSASSDIAGHLEVYSTGLAKIRFNNGTNSPFNVTGNGYLLLPNTASRPTQASSGGGALYVNGGSLNWFGTFGDHQLAPAGPHCGVCGFDTWRIACIHRQFKSWHFECAHCGTEYKGGPAKIIDQLTDEQKKECLQPGMGWEEVLEVWEHVDTTAPKKGA